MNAQNFVIMTMNFPIYQDSSKIHNKSIYIFSLERLKLLSAYSENVPDSCDRYVHKNLLDRNYFASDIAGSSNELKNYFSRHMN